MKQCLFIFFSALFLYSQTIYAHNGGVAIAVPVQGIVVDGDLSDWPEDFHRYEFHTVLSGSEKDARSVSGYFSVAIAPEHSTALYVALEVNIDSTSSYVFDSCSIIIRGPHSNKQDSVIVIEATSTQDEAEDLRGRNLVPISWVQDDSRLEVLANLGEILPDSASTSLPVALGFDVTVSLSGQDRSALKLGWGRGTQKTTDVSHIGDLVWSIGQVSQQELIETLNHSLRFVRRPQDISLNIPLLTISAFAGLGVLILGVISLLLRHSTRKNRDDYRYIASFCLLSYMPLGMGGTPIMAMASSTVGAVYYNFGAIGYCIVASLLLVSKENPKFYTISSSIAALLGHADIRFTHRLVRLPIRLFRGVMWLGVYVLTIAHIIKESTILPYLIGVGLGIFILSVILHIPGQSWIPVTRRGWLLFGICALAMGYEFSGARGWLSVEEWILVAGMPFLAIPISAVIYTLRAGDRNLRGLIVGVIILTFFIFIQLISSMKIFPTVPGVYMFGISAMSLACALWVGKKYRENRREQERQELELEQARKLQISMLPNEKPSVPNLDISWYMETATEVGGDYYDYSLSQDGILTITLGDATGHGMQAGTVVTATKSLFQSYSGHPSITETFSEMSRSLKGMNLPRLGMAMSMLKITDQKLQISSAGIPPALLYRADSKKIEEIEIGGMPLGYSTSFQYQQEEYDLNAGDTIVLMSDGLPERLNPDDEELGYSKTQELFRQCAEKSPEEICQHLTQGGDEWANGRPQDDDVTFVVLKMKGTK